MVKAKTARLTLIIVYEAALGVITGRYVAQTMILNPIPLWRIIYASTLVMMCLAITALLVYCLLAEHRSKR